MISLKVTIDTQSMTVLKGEKRLKNYTISSGKNGVGEIFGSGMTPRGWHIIRAKIGTGCPVNTVFVGRRPTGEFFSPELRASGPERDWILTRILWLSGTELGKNRLGNVDTMRRFIYIHGTPDDVILGTPGSKGCIRMKNTDLLELYDLVSPGTRVLIE